MIENIEIRHLVDESKLRYKDIAKQIDIAPAYLSRCMRYPLKPKMYVQIVDALSKYMPDGFAYRDQISDLYSKYKAEAMRKERSLVAFEPKLGGNGTTQFYVCGKCEEAIDPGDKYCRHCGKAVKW